MLAVYLTVLASVMSVKSVVGRAEDKQNSSLVAYRPGNGVAEGNHLISMLCRVFTWVSLNRL